VALVSSITLRMLLLLLLADAANSRRRSICIYVNAPPPTTTTPSIISSAFLTQPAADRRSLTRFHDIHDFERLVARIFYEAKGLVYTRKERRSTYKERRTGAAAAPLYYRATDTRQLKLLIYTNFFLFTKY